MGMELHTDASSMESILGDIQPPISPPKSLGSFLFILYFINGFADGTPPAAANLDLLAAAKYGDKGFTEVIFGDARDFFYISPPVGLLSLSTFFSSSVQTLELMWIS